MNLSWVWGRSKPREAAWGSHEGAFGCGAEEFLELCVSHQCQGVSAGPRVGVSQAAENWGWFGDRKASLSLSKRSGNASVDLHFMDVVVLN